MEGSLYLPPWVDLPDHVTELILEHLSLHDYIRFAAVCRKWGSVQKDHRLRYSPHPPPMGVHPLPWLFPRVLSLNKGLDCYSPLEKRLRHLRFPTAPTFPCSTLCMASSGGWLLMLDHDDDEDEDDDLDSDEDDDSDSDDVIPTPPSPRRVFFFNPLTSAVIWLPMLPIYTGEDHFGALSSPPYDPDCTILLVTVRRVFMCRVNDPGDGWTMGVELEECIQSAVYCGGKFYCISWKGVLYVIDHVVSTPTLLPLKLDVSTLDRFDRKRYRLVDFGGELLLVMELRNWHFLLEEFEVFRADLLGEKWVKKMDMLTDHVLFLDVHSSFTLLASDVGCKKNCIYYPLELRYHGWIGFDLDTRSWIYKETVRHDIFNLKFCLGRWFLPTLG